MATVLITGANKGIGFAAARQLVGAGHTVCLGARDEGRGRRAAEEIGARFVRVDVTDEGSVVAAAQRIEADGGLDVLVNNAGIEPRQADGGFVPIGEVTAESVRAVFETNVFGHVRMLQAFLPLLEKSAAPVVVNVSSGLGLARDLADPENPTHFYPDVAYPSSKAAVNMLTVQYAKAYPGVRINAVDPGFTKTDLNHHAGTQTVDEGADILVRMAQIGPDGPTGRFFDARGPVAW
jgi:NAD(P)-dependent dehydrogenase (short-subunit alcohol dehydrogenase family)